MVTPFVCVVVLFAAVAWDSALRRAEVLIDMGSSSRKVGGVGGQVGEGRSSSGGDGSLEAVEKRLDSMSERFSGLEGRFSKIKMQQRELNGEQEELSDKEGGLRGAMRQTAKQIAALRGKVDIIQARREEHDIFSPPAARPKKLSQTALLRGTVPKKAPGPRLKILGMMPSVAEARGRRIISDAGVSKYAKEYDAEAREQERRYRDHVRVWMRQQRQYVKKEVSLLAHSLSPFGSHWCLCRVSSRPPRER